MSSTPIRGGSAASSVAATPVRPSPPPQLVEEEELPDEISEPFFKGLGVVFVEIDEEDGAAGAAKCDLCAFAKKHPAPPSESAQMEKDGMRWGVLHQVVDNVTICKQENEEDQHAFHLKCLRAFVLAKKKHFRNKPGCPVCDNLIIDKSKPGAAEAAAKAIKAAGGEKKSNEDDDGDAFGDDEEGKDEVGQTGGKKRKRDKQMYSVWVHIRQATGLKLVKSDKTMNPVAYVNCFGKTVNTARGDGGKTYSCVWNEAFSFQKLMDEEELSKETIQIRIEDHSKLWTNTLIGFVKFQAEQVNLQPNHEFYHLNFPIVNMASKKKDQAVTMQGQLEVSVCVLSEENMKEDPNLPIHIYDAEVEMWAELQDKQEVVDFDINKNYLQNNLNLKKEQDAKNALTTFDIVHVKVYKAEDLPKLDSFGGGWVDAFIELEYKGLMASGQKLKSKTASKTGNPLWNTEFTIPVVHGAPLVYNAFELVVKNHVTLGADDWIGKCAVNISDLLALPDQAPPVWKSLYQDKDGKAPTYRGRVLVEFSVERNVKDAKLFANPCDPCREDLIPPAGTYRLDFELLEGMHLLENYGDYQVDVTLGHTMTGGEVDREREKGGKCWVTFESDSKNMKGVNKTVVPFLTKKSMMVHNLPYPRAIDAQLAADKANAAASAAAAAAASSPSASSSSTSPASPVAAAATPAVEEAPLLDSNGLPVGYRGDATKLNFNSVSSAFSNNTALLDYRSMMPDLIVYVSKKGDRKACVGYLRIPLNQLKRPTENWEHGEDLSLFPVWTNSASARCLPLKPLVELYAACTGFLLFKATLTPVQGAQTSSVAAQCMTTKIEPVPRCRYKLVANVFQAKDMASVDPSGLSSPFAMVQIGDVVLKTKHKTLTTFPLWFEALSATVELPQNLLYAPDFAVTCYNYKSSLFKFHDPSIFMGRADIPAFVASTSQEMSPASWYPLQFEEHQYGNILCSFRLTPEDKIPMGIDVVQTGIDRLIDGWENYAVEVSALDIRGKMAAKHKAKKVDPIFQIECWDEVMNYKASDIKNEKFTVYIRKPRDPVFYSSINFRIYEGKELTGVTSIPVSKILRTGACWYKLLELIMREETYMQKKCVKKWRSFIKKKKFIDPRTIRKTNPAVASPTVVSDATSSYQGEEEQKQEPQSPSEEGIAIHDDENNEDIAPTTKQNSRFAYLKDQDKNKKPSVSVSKKGAVVGEKTSLTAAKDGAPTYSSNDVSIAISDSEDGPDVTRSPANADKQRNKSINLDDQKNGPDAEILNVACKPRNVDADGNEVIEEKDLQYLQCEQLPNKDPGNPFETHWRLGCEYENLPLVKDPFLENELFVGKDEVHTTFLDKLFSRGKHSVGRLRAHFYGYRIGKMPAPDEHHEEGNRVNPLFDSEKYFHPAEYCVRVYVLRALQLRAKKGKAADCDPFVSLSMSGGETFKSEVHDATVNPQFYQCFDFNRVHLPAVESTMSISLFNDSTILSPDLIGSTDIHLENRLFSKVWDAAQKPIERRSLRTPKTGRLAQGFVEVVVQIIPMHLAGNRPLDYLLNPPKRIPWELRVTLLNCKKVTLKKIYKKSDDCCCYDLCAPPNQSDIKLVAGMSGSKQLPQSTDTHPRSIDGEGMFNWRCIFDVDLPSPQMMCNLKVQIWNINWSPDDCLAEANIPLWGFFELARRQLDKEKENPDKWIRTIPRQWIHLTHPQNTDVGDVELEIELLPKDMAERALYKAAKGEEGFETDKNAAHYVLAPPNRPDDSFAWYRIDQQICWRCKYCFKKLRWYLLALLILAIGAVVALAFLHKNGYI